MKMIKTILMMCILAGLASRTEAATCTTNGASAATLTPADITVQRDTPVGSMIGMQYSGGIDTPFTCTNSDPAFTYQNFGIKAQGTYVTTIGGRRIYSTNVPGIGYALGMVSVNNCSGQSGWVDGTNNYDGNPSNRLICLNAGGMLPNQPIQGRIMVQYYKTGTIASGTVSGARLGSYILRNNDTSWQTEMDINTASFNVTSLACAVTNPSILVNMGTIERRAFSGVGSSPEGQPPRSSTILLDCSPGTRVSMQFDGDAWNAAQGILNNSTGEGYATGVGIQLLNPQPVPLGVPFLVNDSAPTSLPVNISAQYIQIKPDITTGSVNVVATFTLTYQ